MELTQNEKQTQKAKANRKIGYTLLWFFLAFFIYIIPTFTYAQPMDEFVPIVLLIVGIVKLFQTMSYKRNAKSH